MDILPSQSHERASRATAVYATFQREYKTKTDNAFCL